MRRSSSEISSVKLRRFRATSRSGWPGTVYEASKPSGRVIAISPAAVPIRTAVSPGPSLVLRLTPTFSWERSQAASKSADGLFRSDSMETDLILAGYWSRAAASSARHGVSLVQLRSVSPGVYSRARDRSAVRGRGDAAASVIRRIASCASSSPARLPGALPGHQITTGESGNSSGRITEAGCAATAPRILITTTSPGVPSPIRTSASSAASRPAAVTTSKMRDGCSRPATMLASSAFANSDSSQTMIKVSTMPWAGLPRLRRIRTSSAEIFADVVPSSVRIMAVSR